MKKVILSLVIFLLGFLVISCSPKTQDFNTLYSSLPEESLTSCKKLDIDYTVKDNNVLVYEYVRNTSFGESAEVTEKIYTLSTSTFDLTSKEEYKVNTDYNRHDYLNVTLKESLIDSYEKTDKGLTIKVLKDQASEVLGIDNLNINSNVTLSVEIENNLIKALTASFTNTSGQDASLVISFSY